MTDKHTPGPWRYSGPYTSFQMVLPKPVRDGGGLTIYAGKQKTICSSTWCGPEDRDVAEANARLIATSPDLLAECEEAAAVFEEYARLHLAKGTPDGNEKADRNMRQAMKIRATIAKATGAA